MKRASLILIMGILLVGFHVVSCGDDESDEKTGGDGDGDSDVDGGGDNDTGTGEEEDTGTGDGPCGEEFTPCCEDGDECEEGLSSSISFMDGSCSCLTPCTFNECTAGTEQGYCSTIIGPYVVACVNETDFQGDPVECTTGDTCTTPSGDENGTCIEMVGNDFVTMVNRCVLECDNPPTECDDDLVCSPEMSMVDNNFLLDYDNGHCIVPPQM